MRRSTPTKRPHDSPRPARAQRASNKSLARRSKLESQTTRTPRARAKRPEHLRHVRRTKPEHRPETECRTSFPRARSKSSARARSNCPAESFQSPASSSFRPQSNPTRACTSGCKRSSPPRVMRSCTCPKCAAPAESAQDLCCTGCYRGRKSCPGTAVRRPPQIRAASHFRDVLAALDNQLAARKDLARISAHLESFEHRIIHAHIVCLRADRVLRFRVPHHNVGVTARRQRPLFRIHSENSRRRRRNNLNESIDRNLSVVDAVMMQQMQSILDARPAVWNFREVVFPQYFLDLKTKRTMIGRHNLQIVVFQSIP